MTIEQQQKRDAEQERLTELARGKICLRCNTEPRVANLNDWPVLRCDCFPDGPSIGDRPTAIGREMAKRETDLESANQEVKDLTIQAIKNYICAKATDAEAFVFVRMCKVLDLDPYIHEAYLVKYSDRDPAQMIIGVQAHRKWAARNPGFRDAIPGIIVRPKQPEAAPIEYRQGKFIEPFTEELLGGWADVRMRGDDEPKRETVAIHEYMKVRPAYDSEKSSERLAQAWALVPIPQQLKDHYIARGQVPQSTWGAITSTMICKVAETQALRRVFPEDVGKPYAYIVEEVAKAGMSLEESEELPALGPGESVDRKTGEILTTSGVPSDEGRQHAEVRTPTPQADGANAPGVATGSGFTDSFEESKTEQLDKRDLFG